MPPSDLPMLLFLPLSLHHLPPLPPDSENNSLPSDSVSFTTASFPPLSLPGTRLGCQRPRQADSTMEITQVQEASSRSNHPQSGLDKGAMSSCQLGICCTPVASFAGHSHLQFLIACSLMYWSSSSFSRAAIVLLYNKLLYCLVPGVIHSGTLTCILHTLYNTTHNVCDPLMTVS